MYPNDCSFKAPGDPVLTADMDTCSEALAQLDDVIMHTFQQCVYHLTKVKRKTSLLNLSSPCIVPAVHCSLKQLFHFCLQRPCTRSFQPYWTPTLSPVRRRRKKRMEHWVERQKRKEKEKPRWMMCQLCHPKLQGLWRCIAVL